VGGAAVGVWLSLVYAEVASSNLATPTILQNEPFSEQLEGFFLYGAKACAVQQRVKTEAS